MSIPIAPTQEQYPSGTYIGIEKDENVVEATPVVLKNEYLVGGLNTDDDTLRILMHNYDAWSGKLTDVKIAEMLRDAEIHKCFTVIKNGVLGDGVTFTPALTEPTAIAKPVDGEVEPPERKTERLAREREIERFELAKKYADFTTRAFDNLEVSFRETLDDMLSALPFGNRVAEKVFVTKQDREFGKPLLYFDRLNVKPRKATIFVVDKYWNHVGFKVYIKEKDKDGKEILKEKVLRKEKFATLTWGMVNQDPRGESFLQPVYTAYQLKQSLWPEYLRWMIYSAVPPIVGTASDLPDSRKVLRDANNELITDAQGNPVYESDVGALLNALKQVRNSSAIAIPAGAKVETLNSSVSGDPFKGFRDVLNQEMEMALIKQTLATSDSRNNTRAASQTHISILDDLIWRVKGLVRDMITGMVKHLMLINFPNFDESLTPIVSMGDTARREFAGDVGAISQLHISGFLGESQKVGVDNLLGLPPRDVYSDREFERQKALEKVKMEAMLAEITAPQVAPTPAQEPEEERTSRPPRRRDSGDN
jgi:hypothetical protein